MPLLAKYQRSDGLIRGVWSANTVELVRAHADPDDAVHGYVLLEDEDVHALQTQYVLPDGVRTPKPLVTLVAWPNPFPAGTDVVCSVRVEPFVPCTILVNATPYALVPEDQVLELTTDIPMVFQVSLPYQAACWGEPLVVEAL